MLKGALMCTVVFSAGEPDVLCLEYSVGPTVDGYGLVSKARVWKVDERGTQTERHRVGEELFLKGQGYNKPLSSWGTRPRKRKKKYILPSCSHLYPLCCVWKF